MARLDILKHFEMLKRKFNPGVDERSRLQLSYLGEELSAGRLGELVAEHNKKNSNNAYHLKQRGASSVDIPPALMTSFFKPLFENIKSKVQSLMDQATEKNDPVKFVFMVGGFSESPFLKAEIKKTFEDSMKLHVLVPRRPQVSVIRGACMFGLNPRSITSRMSKMTYGINTLTTFDREQHRPGCRPHRRRRRRTGGTG